MGFNSGFKGLNPSSPNYSAGYLNFAHDFRKNLNISRTKRDKFVKQKAICGERIRHCTGRLKNAVISLLRKGQHMFLKKSCKYPRSFTYILVEAATVSMEKNEKMS